MSNKKDDNKLEEELTKIITRIVKNYETKLTKDDFKEITSEIIPEIDKIISIKIKGHFKDIANYILKTLK